MAMQSLQANMGTMKRKKPAVPQRTGRCCGSAVEQFSNSGPKSMPTVAQFTLDRRCAPAVRVHGRHPSPFVGKTLLTLASPTAEAEAHRTGTMDEAAAEAEPDRSALDLKPTARLEHLGSYL